MADSKVQNTTENKKEVWKDIPNTDGFYQISNKGRVRSWHNNTNTPGKSDDPLILKTSVHPRTGYELLNIRINGNKETFSVHRLVAKAFIPNPKNKPQTNHKDGIKTNNTVTNLEWATRSENQQHAFENGLKIMPKGEEHWSTSLTETDVIIMRKQYASGDFYQYELAEMYGICRTAVTQIINRKRWKHC